MDAASIVSIEWNFSRKFLFRFLFIYFLLYCFPFPLDGFDFLAPVAKPYYDFIDWLIPLAGDKLFRIQAHVAFPTFDKVDDSFYGLIFIYLNLLISFFGAITWSLFDPGRKNYVKLNQWLMLYLRFFLAAYLFGYGFVKVFPSQFQAITASRLTMRVGDQSPMLLAWNFMGYSTVMMRINGWAEVVAGLLLLFRRTTTLGALLSTGIFTFVVMMDFTFNVFVRLLSSHLLLISIYIVLCDRKRLLNVFLLNKPVQAMNYMALISNARGRRVFSAFLAVLAICLIYSTVSKGIEAENSFGRKAAPVPLYGIYNTIYFIKNNDTIGASDKDGLRWKELVIDGGPWNQICSIESNNDKRSSYQVFVDTSKYLLRIQPRDDSSQSHLFHFSFPDTTLMLLKGRWSHDSLEILLKKYDLNNYLLHKEGFKWIAN